MARLTQQRVSDGSIAQSLITFTSYSTKSKRRGGEGEGTQVKY